jgi:hypothetical protein
MLSASILTAGLLGRAICGAFGGGIGRVFQDGDEIELTQSAMILEQRISRLLFNKAEEGKKTEKAVSPSAPLSTPAVQSDQPAHAKAASALLESTGQGRRSRRCGKRKNPRRPARTSPPPSSVAAHDHRSAGHGAESRPKTARLELACHKPDAKGMPGGFFHHGDSMVITAREMTFSRH